MKHLFIGLSIFLLFVVLCFFLLFTHCNKNENQSKAIGADAEITEKLKILYSTYDKYGTNNSLYNHPIPKDLFSKDLEKSLKEAVDATNASIEKIKKSDSPTDKPAVLEGSLFTSLYEGYTNYKIKSIEIMESTDPLGDAADVTIDFEHNTYKLKWTDKVHLINAFDSGWRIDNITFDSITSNNSKDLKANLKEFVLTATH